MNYRLLTSLACTLICHTLTAQDSAFVSCGQKEVTEQHLRQNPASRNRLEQIERNILDYTRKVKAGILPAQRTQAVVMLPVVVHIIHNNGPENISDARVASAIQHLNDAFAHTSYYNSANGVNTQIQFCLAQRDPDGNFTNGITRNVSPYTVMGGTSYYSDDINVKNVNRWDPRCYINIWLVRDIPGSVAGYAYLPSAHGMNMDGILMEAGYFGSSNASDVVIIHEMGHYLGLYHTFEGACKNDNCDADGDRVCDTPPDQSTAATACNTSMNSCATDALSGFGTDVSDLKEDFMDYGNFNCMKVFTQGQADRMYWHIQHVRKSLLDCKSCLSPCPAPVTAGFNTSDNNILAGATVNFTNTSLNASGYHWYLNGVLQSSAGDFAYTFNVAGTYVVSLSALSGNTLCDSALKKETIVVTCPVSAQFSPLHVSAATNETVSFTNSSTGANAYSWAVNGAAQSTAIDFSTSFTAPGQYIIRLMATGATCSDTITGSVVVSDTDPTGDSCITRTFSAIITGAGDEEAYDVAAMPDGGHIMAGKSIPVPGGNAEALIVKTNNKGEVVWAKTYGSPGEDAFYRIISTSDNNYVAIGQGRFKTGHVTDIYVVKIDPGGNIIWSKAFGAGTANGEVGRSVVETADGGFGIAADYNTNPAVVQPLYLKLDVNGNLKWNRLLSVNNSGQAYDIVAVGSDLIGTGVVSRAGGGSTFNDGYIVKLAVNDGTVKWTRNIESGGRSNRLQQVQLANEELVFAMYNADSWSGINCVPVIFKTDTSGNVTFAKQYELEPGLAPNQLSMYMQVTTDGGYIFSYNTLQNITTAKLAAAEKVGNLQWVKSYPPATEQLLYNIISDNYGHTVVGRAWQQTGSRYDILLLKTNKTGNIKTDPAGNCSVSYTQHSDLNAVVQSTVAGSNYWASTGPATLETMGAVPDINILLLQSQILCIDSTLCELPPEDTCARSTFQKTYDNDGSYQAFYIHTTPDGGSVIGGTGNATAGDITPLSPLTDAFAMKLRPNGSVQWAKRIGGSKYDEFRKIKPTTDGGCIAIGSTASFSTHRGIYLVKLNAAGNLEWAKNFSANSQYGDLGLDVIQTSDGGYAFTATNNAAPPHAHGIVAKTDAAGNIIWNKRLYRNDGVDIHSIIEDADTLVVGADYWVTSQQKYYGSIIKLHKSNGNILSSISFSAGNRGNFFVQVHKTVTGFMAGFHIIDGDSYSFKQQGVLGLSQNLENLFSEKVNQEDINVWSTITPTADGGYVATQGQYAFGQNFYLYKGMGNGTFDWQRIYGTFPGIIMQKSANAQQYADGTFIAACTWYSPPNISDGNLHVVKTDTSGNTPGCRMFYPTTLVSKITTVIQPITWNNITAFNYNPNITITPAVANVNFTVINHCKPPCILDSIAGPDSVCNISDTLTYELIRNPECTAPAEWRIDTTIARIFHTTDSTIHLLFRQTGTVTLYALLTSSCELQQDSILITINDSPDSLNLGPDQVWCKESTIPLNAGAGFRSYLWQDGSSDSTFTVMEFGTYYVTVTDYCGNQLSDTVIISKSPDIPFDLGPDLYKCTGDTLTITAPAGFSKYYWSPAYRVNNSYAGSIKVYTDKDTTYTVVAEKSPGCLVTDTVKVFVHPVTLLNLPADTGICRHDSLLLDAGPGFSAWRWNTGATGPQIYAREQGLYYVAATDANSCITRDSVTITVNELPVVDLGPDTIICRNASVIFNAANGPDQYVWQDGSQSATLTATQPGVYWVQVTDIRLCVNSDTVQITGIVDPPAHFLPDTAHVCEGEPRLLQANGSFVTYRWDNTVTSPSLVVTSAGMHILAVTGQQGCLGMDTINVLPVDCKKAIYFPNAFTPNNDRLNNQFRPVVTGTLEKFHLVIYNRWGGKIFETFDASRGWNGTFNGKPQDTNTFVWVCTYKFTGINQVEKREKGIITLIK